MTENFQDKLHQADCKQSKVAKICGVIRRELECEKCSQTFCKILQDKTCKIKQMQNISLTLSTFLNQLKTFYEKVAPTTTPLTLQHLKF